MEFLILATLSILICIASYIAYKIQSFNNPAKLSVLYFSEVQETKGYFKEEKILRVKAQLMLGQIPVGQAFVISEQKIETINKEEIKEIVQKFAEPLVKIGVAAIAA